MDYDAATTKTIAAASERRPFAVTALAVHGVMTGFLDPLHAQRINQFDLVLPDGQPVRWALNVLHETDLEDRVCGPAFMLQLCQIAEYRKLSVFLYGSTSEVLTALENNLRQTFPTLVIAGKEPSKFRPMTREEHESLTSNIRNSGASIVFVGLGCPRQEVWAFENRNELPAAIIAVGAAFDFHAGTVQQAPKWMQDRGLEWVFRLMQEPGRLWKRYLLLNPYFLALVVSQKLGVKNARW